jgi:hypothetical protein
MGLGVPQVISSINIAAFPKLEHAIVEIAFDNGCINRFITKEQVVENAFEACVARFDPSELQRVESHLATMSPSALDTLLTGEWTAPESEIEELVDAVLDHAFENLIPD